MIDFDALKSFLPDYVNSVLKLEKSRKAGKNQYNCPLCGSGTGKNKTGAFTIKPDGLHWTCFVCEGKHGGGDIVDLYEKINNVTHAEAVRALSAMYNVNTNETTTTAPKNKKQDTAKTPEVADQYAEQEKAFFASFFLLAQENLNKPEYIEVLEYLHKRGLDDATIKHFGIGACSEKEMLTIRETALNWNKTIFIHNGQKCVVIPTGERSAFFRWLGDVEPNKTKYGPQGLFNLSAFDAKEDYIFIVEGQFDVFSFYRESLPAIGLASAANTGELLEYLQKNPTNKRLFLALDNDEAGARAVDALKTGLKRLNLCFEVVDIPKPYKDPNELYTADLGLFMNTFDIGNKEKRELQEQAAGNTIYNFLDKVTKERVLIPTGLEPLDKILHGGLSNELYTISAMPGAGKTALISYIADNISAAGHPVIYFSLEVPKEQIQARGLSRLSFMLTGRNTTKAVAYSDVLYDYENLTDEKKQVLFECMELYKKNAQNLFIEEPENPYLEDLVNTCKRYKQILGKTPVVVIDYLQLLQPKPSKENRYTDKRAATEKVVQEIRQLAKIEKMPVLVISSLNRDGYGEEVKMESQKETGLIEYAAALMLGLYYTGMDDLDKKATRTQIRQWDAETPRRISLDVLKIRNGAPVKDPLRLEFYSAYNYFRPC